MVPETNSLERKLKAFIKTDFAKVSSGALLTATLVILYNLFIGTQEDFTVLSSGRITLDEAYTLTQNWSDTALIHKDSSQKRVPLRGFVFNAVQLDSVINRNAALDSGVQADEVIIYIGRSGITTTGHRPFRHKYTNIHLVVLGVKGTSLLIKDQRTPKPGMPAFLPSIYDKADPCPGPNCPKSKL